MSSSLLRISPWAFVVLLSACSAVVSPDPTRLGAHDAGAGTFDAGAGMLDAGMLDAGAGTGPGLGDPSRCGPSAARCRDDQLCVGGSCVCRPPLVPVGDRCVDLRTDPDNCGMPDMRCPDACAMGRCVGGCPDGTRSCDGACVDLRTDPTNCGECGRSCGADEACQGGDCRDVSLATGCTSCPCEACRGNACCTLPRLGLPYCLDADRCP